MRGKLLHKYSQMEWREMLEEMIGKSKGEDVRASLCWHAWAIRCVDGWKVDANTMPR